MKQINSLTVVLLAFVLLACSTTSKMPKSGAYENSYNEQPLKVFIAAPINNIAGDGSEDQDKFYFPADAPLPAKAFDSAVLFNSALPIDHSPVVKDDEYWLYVNRCLYLNSAKRITLAECVLLFLLYGSE